MLVSLRRHLAYIAVPKTGTTALEQALAPHCDICLVGKAKHMKMRAFERYMLPYLQYMGLEEIETVCVVREPVDWLGSWYRYRSRDYLAGSPKSTRGVSFPEFVEAYLDPEPPAFARVGRMSRFVSGRSREPAVTHMFRYENMAGFTHFLHKRFRKRLEIPKANVSRRGELALPPALRTRLETERAAEFVLYADRAR
jgi:hypothetical protein